MTEEMTDTLALLVALAAEQKMSRKAFRDACDLAYVKEALSLHNGKVGKTAVFLKVERTHFHNVVKSMGLRNPVQAAPIKTRFDAVHPDMPPALQLTESSREAGDI